jgi:hypothetical protein
MRTHKRVCKGGGLRDGPVAVTLPTFTSAIKPRTPAFGTGEQDMPPEVPSASAGSFRPSDLTANGEPSLRDDEVEDDD